MVDPSRAMSTAQVIVISPSNCLCSRVDWVFTVQVLHMWRYDALGCTIRPDLNCECLLIEIFFRINRNVCYMYLYNYAYLSCANLMRKCNAQHAMLECNYFLAVELNLVLQYMCSFPLSVQKITQKAEEMKKEATAQSETCKSYSITSSVLTPLIPVHGFCLPCCIF